MKRTIKICRHEAAHAVLAEEMGARVHYLRITRHGGFCCSEWRGKKLDPLKVGIVAFAGHAADMRWHRAPLSLWPAEDVAIARSLGFRDRSLATVLAVARGVLSEFEFVVEQLAHELKRKDLTGAEVRSIIRRAKGGVP